MSDTGNPTGQEPTAVQTPAEPAAQATSTAGTDTADRWAGIPEEWAWTKGAVESANREAASRRVALRELEDKVKDAKTPEEFTKAMADVKAKEDSLTQELARERAARKHKLDDDVLEFLTGTTEEQIEAQAAKLANLKPGAVTPPAVITQTPPSGGVTPSSETPTDESGKSAWKKYKERNSR